MRRPRPVASAIAALVAATVVLGALPPPGSAQAGAAQAPTVRLLGRTPWVGDGFDFELSLQVAAAPAGSTVRLQVHDRVRSRSEFARTLDGEALNDVQWVDGAPSGRGRAGTGELRRPDRPRTGPRRSPRSTPPASTRCRSTSSTPTARRSPPCTPTSCAWPPSIPTPRSCPSTSPSWPASGTSPSTWAPSPRSPRRCPRRSSRRAPRSRPPSPPTPTWASTCRCCPRTSPPSPPRTRPSSTSSTAALGASELLGEPWVAIDEAAWDDADPALLAQLRSRGLGAVDDGLGRRPGTARVAAGDSLASVQRVGRRRHRAGGPRRGGARAARHRGLPLHAGPAVPPRPRRGRRR